MEEEVSTNESVVNPEIRKKAEAQGWSDKEHWKGKPDDWVDAETFVKRGDEWLGSVRAKNESLDRDLKATKQQLRELQATTEEFKKFQKDAYERKVSDLESKLASIKEERAQAISDGDGKKVNALDDTLDKTKEDIREAKEASKEAAKPVTVTPDTPDLDPALQSWLGNNEWFGKDKRLTGIANGVGESLRFEFPKLKGQEFLDKLDEVLTEEFPDKFGGAKKTRTARTVESGSGRGSSQRGNAHSYDNLPSDAKAACDRFVKSKIMTKEEYVAEYSWD